jgi:hypothetical protein
MSKVVEMLDGKHVHELLEGNEVKRFYYDEKSKKRPLGKSAIKYYIDRKYVRSIPPDQEKIRDEHPTILEIKKLMVT